MTGAARSPITSSLCAKLMARGWQVAGLDATRSEATMSLEVDINDGDAVARAVAEVENSLGPINALITGGMRYEIREFDDIDVESWDSMLSIHLNNVVNTCWAVAPLMMKRMAGTIILISSEFAIDGTVEGWWAAHYAAAKGAIVGINRSLSVELEPFGIRVSSVAPGPTEVPSLPATPEYLASIPLRRRLKLDEVADAIVFMLEEGTCFVGQTISPNAGAVI